MNQELQYGMLVLQAVSSPLPQMPTPLKGFNLATVQNNWHLFKIFSFSWEFLVKMSCHRLVLLRFCPLRRTITAETTQGQSTRTLMAEKERCPCWGTQKQKGNPGADHLRCPTLPIKGKQSWSCMWISPLPMLT